MRRRLRALVVMAVLLAVSSAANELADVRSSAAAMACCAKTGYQCAGVRTPDDCCKRMHHSPAHVAPSTAPVARNASASPAIAPLPAVYLPFSTPVIVVATPPDFTRPHDPPHLHTFSLADLILLGNTVKLSELRQVIKNNGFVSNEAQVTVRGSVSSVNGQSMFNVTGTGEQFVLVGTAPRPGSTVEIRGRIDLTKPDQRRLYVTSSPPY